MTKNLKTYLTPKKTLNWELTYNKSGFWHHTWMWTELYVHHRMQLARISLECRLIYVYNRLLKNKCWLMLIVNSLRSLFMSALMMFDSSRRSPKLIVWTRKCYCMSGTVICSGPLPVCRRDETVSWHGQYFN